MAYNFLIENNYSTELAEKVKHCIFTHRFRSENPPETIEAKILFDVDKLDACGLIGIARTLMYKGKEIALNRQKNAVFFYENLYSELTQF